MGGGDGGGLAQIGRFLGRCGEVGVGLGQDGLVGAGGSEADVAHDVRRYVTNHPGAFCGPNRLVERAAGLIKNRSVVWGVGFRACRRRPGTGYPLSPTAIVPAVEFDRPVLRAVDVHLEDVVSVTVVLSSGGREHRGEAEGAIDSASRARVVGEATLRALEAMTGVAKFDLTAVGTSTLEDVTIALVQVEEPGQEEQYVGSALIRRGDVVLATARAVLDALNRRLAFLQLRE